MLRGPAEFFAPIQAIGLTLPGVQTGAKADGSPILTVDGRFLAGPAVHRSAEPNTLVVRLDPDDRQAYLDAAPGTYYVTGYYRQHPVILVRLALVTPADVLDLLSTARRAVLADWRRRGGS